MTYLHHQSAAVKKKAGGQIPCSCSYGKAYQQQLKHTTRLLLATDKLNPPHGACSKACCFTAVFAGRVLNPGCVTRLTSGVCVCFSVFPTEERKKERKWRSAWDVVQDGPPATRTRTNTYRERSSNPTAPNGQDALAVTFRGNAPRSNTEKTTAKEPNELTTAD